VVECGGLENRCSPSGEPGVRIPLSPQIKLFPQQAAGFLFCIMPNQACFRYTAIHSVKFLKFLLIPKLNTFNLHFLQL